MMTLVSLATSVMVLVRPPILCKRRKENWRWPACLLPSRATCGGIYIITSPYIEDTEEPVTNFHPQMDTIMAEITSPRLYESD